jgi:cell division protein FtsB
MDILKRLKNKFDLCAVPQLQAELARLSAQIDALQTENKELQMRADQAEAWAEDWREDYLALQQSVYPESSPAITQSGHLAVVHS